MCANNTPQYVEIDHPIVALATPRSKSALAIIRITGKNCIAMLEPFVQSHTKISSWHANHTKLCTLKNAHTQEVLDEAMLTIFKAPHSYTGQDSVEISMHGSLLGIDKLLSLLHANGFEAAEAGEFTKRAFLSGKLDLTQAEAIHALIDAHTAESHSLALSQLAGSVSSFINNIKTSLVELAATCNICLDYPDDEIQESTEIDSAHIYQLIEMLTQSINSYELTKIHREGAVIVLTGKTNVGKSTLFNSFLKEERSIVSDTHGTTRDFIESQMSLQGIPLRLFDTAGLRSTTAHIEKEGINRSYTLMQSADLILYTVDASIGIGEDDKKELAHIIENLSQANLQAGLQNNSQASPQAISEHSLDKLVIVWNKIDLTNQPAPSEIIIGSHHITQIHPISAINFHNVNQLQEFIYHALHNNAYIINDDLTVINSLRQQQHLKECRTSLEHVIDGLEQNIPLDMISLDVNTALKALGNITGEVHNEEVLDVMFANFCVGK